MDLSKLEIHLLALRDASCAALDEVRQLKTAHPQQHGEITQSIEKHLEYLSSGKWGKKNKKAKPKQKQLTIKP